MRDPKGRKLPALMTASGAGRGIVLTNLPARGWLDYDGLKAQRDDLIMVNIVGRRDGSCSTISQRPGGLSDGYRASRHRRASEPCHAGLGRRDGARRVECGSGRRPKPRIRVRQYVRIALADSAFAVMSHLGYVAEAPSTGRIVRRPAIMSSVPSGATSRPRMVGG